MPGSEDPKGVGVFARFIGAPEDQNLIDFYADGGFTFSGMIKSRPDDSFAIGFAYTGISDQVTGFDIDSGLPVARNYEALLEICYTMQLTIRLDAFSRTSSTSGSPAAMCRMRMDEGVEDAAVFGARTTISF